MLESNPKCLAASAQDSKNSICVSFKVNCSTFLQEEFVLVLYKADLTFSLKVINLKLLKELSVLFALIWSMT